MKLIILCSLAFPMFLAASPIACPTTTYADLLTLSSCTVGGYTLSNFSFSSSAANGSTAYTASEFTVAPHDAVYDPNSYLYFGLNLTGDPGAGAGQSVVTDISFTVTTTDGSNEIRAVALGEDATVGTGGSVTLTDSGVTGLGNPFAVGVSNATPLAQTLLSPTSSVQSNAVLSTMGPDAVHYFTIDVSNLTGVPEPATSFLIGFGLLGITYAGKKLRKRG